MVRRVFELLSAPGLGGTETFAVSLADHLGRAGVQCEIVNLWRGSGMRAAAESAGVRYAELGRGLASAAVARLWRAVDEAQPEVVCAYGLRASLAMRTLVAHPRRPVLVTGLRGLDHWRRPHHVAVDRATQWAVRRFICNSDEVARVRRERERTPPDRLVTIVNGIDVEVFDRTARRWPDRAALGLPEDGLLCLTVANLREPKGHDYLLEVMAELGPLAQQVHFAWVGATDGWPALQAQARARGVLDRIIVPGPQADVRPWLAAADLFVLPSRFEGMPRALMEAMAMQCPCLATAVGGTPQVVRDDVDGVLVPYGDGKAAARALAAILADAPRRARLAAAGRERIVSAFSMEQVAARYLALFEALVASPSP